MTLSLPESALIFDLDGTVADTMALHRASWVAFGTHHGFAADHPEILASSKGRTTPESMRVLFGEHLSEPEMRTHLDHKQGLFWEVAQTQLKPIAGFLDFAQWVSASERPRALGTAGESHNVGRILNALGLQDFFQARVTGDMGLRGKPNPDIFLHAAQLIGARPEECIVFEDAIAGVAAAGRAGMRCIAVCSDHAPEELQGEHVIAHITDYRQLLELLG
jgi:beta-phosphoglucomutase-like phosphatase (HAD superfamily)